MKPLSKFALLFAASITFPTLAQNGQTDIASSLLQSERTCFRGMFSTHAGWLKTLSEKKKNFNTKAFLSTFPESYFNDIKQNVECSDFTYRVDGINVEGYYLKPREHQGKLPVIVFNRGGNGSYGNMVFANKIDLPAQLAEKGYLVIGSQYRGGSEWRENNGEDEFGGADVDDVVKLVEIVKQMPDADPKRIAMMGWSRGGMQTYLAAKRLPELKTLVAVAGVSDGEKQLKRRPAMEKVYKERVPGFEANRKEELAKRSVIKWADKLPDAPVLLIHGDQDERVNVEQSVELAEKLKSLGHPHELVIYKDDGHSLRKHRPELAAKLESWFKTYL